MGMYKQLVSALANIPECLFSLLYALFVVIWIVRPCKWATSIRGFVHPSEALFTCP